MNDHLVIVAFDISDNRRRRRLVKLLMRYGDRLQFSVFACRLTPSQGRSLDADLSRLPLEVGESIRVYRPCKCCVGHVVAIGARPPEPVPRVVVL